MDLNNATNFQSGIMSYITISSGVSLPTTINPEGATGSIAFDAPNTFLLNIIKGLGNYTANGVLLFDVHINGLLGATSADQFYVNYNISADIGGQSSTYQAGSVLTTSSLNTSFVRIPCLVSDLMNSSNTSLSIVVTNNSTGLGALCIQSVSSFVPVTYLPLGFTTS